MGSRSETFREYSRAERLSDAAVHIIGIAFALMAVPVLVTLAAVWRGDPVAVVGTLIYGTSLIAMVLCSGLYHMLPYEDWKGVLRRLDHSAIYIKIAGTYTPFLLLAGGGSGHLLTGIWTAALAGTSLKVYSPDRYRWVGLTLYLGMGWAGVVAGDAMIQSLSTEGFVLILVGGAIYTVGVIFFLWEMLPFHNTIWHVFVLVASFVFYAAVVVELAAISDLPQMPDFTALAAPELALPAALD